MTIKPEVLKAMVDAGATAEILLAAIQADAAVKSAGAIRQKRYRDAKLLRNGDVTVTDGNATVTDSNATQPEPYKDNRADITASVDALISNGSSFQSEPVRLEEKPNTSCLSKKSDFAPLIEIEFEDSFWPVWPNKVGKPSALKAFRSARRKAELSEIISGLHRYVASKPPERDWLNPATFLNQERWNDTPAPQARAGPTQSRNGWGEVAADNIERKQEHASEKRRIDSNVQLLPFAGRSEPDSGGGDASGVSGNDAAVLIGNCFRRM